MKHKLSNCRKDRYLHTLLLKGDANVRIMQTLTDEKFLELIMNKKNDVYKIAYSYMKNEQDALDVVQEATCKAFMKKGTLKNIEYFNTWFIRILINESISALRKNKKYAPMLEDVQDKSTKNIDESFFDLNKALELLHIKYKTIIILKFHEDLTFKQIGEILKKPESTIKTDYYKAMEILRKELDYERI